MATTQVLKVGTVDILKLSGATLVESWDENLGTDDERLGRRYEVERAAFGEVDPAVVHLTDDYLFPLVRRRPGVYGCRHSDVMLHVVESGVQS